MSIERQHQPSFAPEKLPEEGVDQKPSARRKKSSPAHLKHDTSAIAHPLGVEGSPHLAPAARMHHHSTTSGRLSHRARAMFTVGNSKGLHTRPSTELVKCASGFRAQIMLRYQKISVNAKSLLGILTLAAGKGSRIIIEAEGEDAQEAIDALLHLAQNRFFMNF